MKKLATLKNIADRVGVNPATVSRALDPAKRQLISEEVREKIEKAAEKLNYRPRISGRSLATNKSMCIGLVLHNLTMDFGSPFFSILLSSFTLRLSQEGYSVQILPVVNEKTRENEILNYLYSGRVDGFFIGQTLVNDKVLNEIESRNVPAVIFDEIKQVKRKLSCFRINENSGASEAANFLMQKGVSKVAYRAHDYMKTAQTRITAFDEAWLTASGKHLEKIIYKVGQRGNLSARMESYKNAIDNIMDLKKYEAIACCTDLSALGLMDALSEKGIIPGKDILIVGYDNIEENPHFQPTRPVLSSIDRMYGGIGVAVAEMLVRQLSSEVISNCTKEFQTKFISRASTGESL